MGGLFFFELVQDPKRFAPGVCQNSFRVQVPVRSKNFSEQFLMPLVCAFDILVFKSGSGLPAVGISSAACAAFDKQLRTTGTAGFQDGLHF